MSSAIKVCIYFKSKEKPMILTDILTKESTHDAIIKLFQDCLKGENRIETFDFANDVIMFNCKDLEAVKISKPELDDTIMASEDPLEVPEGDLSIKSETDETMESDNSDDAFENDDKIEVIE